MEEHDSAQESEELRAGLRGADRLPPVSRPFRGESSNPGRAALSRQHPGRAWRHGRGGGPDGKRRSCVGLDLSRWPRPLPVPDRGVRAVRPRQCPAARHVSERHQARGRNRGDDRVTVARRRSCRAPPRRGGVRCRDLRRYREPDRPDARLPGARQDRERHHGARGHRPGHRTRCAAEGRSHARHHPHPGTGAG